ncbi:MAG TPA: ABC transporter ATP-binding protein [Patescibacteria group bacterium]|nr:ABC transporter ATP-binding protein [Patescibacteria group bacterium]
MVDILEVRDLRKAYRGFTLDGVSLAVPRGYIMGLIGPNGAGKTTTIKILMNMIRADGGEVHIFGLTHRESEREIKSRVGYVGEEQYFYMDKRVAWTGRFVSQYFERWDATRFAKLLDDFGIDPKKKIKSLSKGQKVKLSLAIALSHDPELLILDEPTAGLDPVIRRDVLDMLMRFRDDGERSVLISSHITDDIMRIADYVAFIVEGRIAINAEKDEIMANWKKIHFRDGAIDSSIVSSLANVGRHTFGCSGITDRYGELREALAPAVTAGDVKVENVSLDDVLIAFVKGGKR